MEHQRLDIVVFGATGFTGKHAVKILASLCKDNKYSDLTWGISGRSKDKLQHLLCELEEVGVDKSKVCCMECDIKNEASIKDVTRRARVVMNATGPNTLLSAPVVKACIQTQTDYVDISAELHHMLNIYRTYNKLAESANVLIVPACGFASIPATMGLVHLERHFNGVLHSVECYTELDIPKRVYFPLCGDHCLVHYGTWASLVHELKNFRQYIELKKQTFPEIEPEPEELKKSFFHRKNGRFWFPYPGPDNDIVKMTNVYLKEKRGKSPYHFKSYTTMPLLLHFFIVLPAFFIYYMLSNYFKCFRKLLWKFPRFFTFGYISHKGPSEKMANDTKYSFTLNGTGWGNADVASTKLSPSKTLAVKVSGNDPGYKTTAVAFLFSAIAISKERSKMPQGGVLTSGAAFSDTHIIENLNNFGLKFEIIDT